MPTLSTAYPLLADTAAWTAAVRAQESQHQDRLFDDPWAGVLAGETGAAWIHDKPPASVTPIILRTRFFDDYLRRITQEASIRQIVLPGAGLDTRAFRLAWPEGVTCFELEQPSVLARKERILQTAGAAAQCRRVVIPADLTQAWPAPLAQAGFRAEEPSGWLLEGFLFYLPSASVTALLEQVSALAAPGSWLGFDIINSEMLTSPITRPWLEMQRAAGAPWIGVLDDPVSFLAAQGWQAALTQAGQPDAHHGRWTLPIFPTLLPNVPHNWFVTAQKQAVSAG